MTKTYPNVSQLSLAILLSVLSTTLAAQVYQTTDKDGNPVFSDKPSSGASEVEIQTTNTANSVEVRPESSPPQRKAPERSENTAPEQNETLDPYLVNSDRDDRRRLDRPGRQPENKPERPSRQPAKITRPANRR
jgi:hypothetical protein